MSGNVFEGLHSLNLVDLRFNACIDEGFSNPTKVAVLRENVNEKCGNMANNEPCGPCEYEGTMCKNVEIVQEGNDEDVKIIQPHSIYISMDSTNHRVNLNWFHVVISSDVVIVITDKPMKVDESPHISFHVQLPSDRFKPTKKHSNVDKVMEKNKDAEFFYELGITTSDGTQDFFLWHNFEEMIQGGSDGCYNLWYYLIVDGVVIDSGCKETRRDWMDEMNSTLTDHKVRQVFLPGTHDSVSYQTDFNPMLQNHRWKTYALTQDDDVYSQLKHGIRYLDIRVSYYAPNLRGADEDDKFWGVHGPFSTNPLLDILEQVKRFIDETNEIVIFDIHQLAEGFDNIEIHKELVSLLYEKLSTIAADSSLGWDATLGDIWQSGKRLIIGYSDLEKVQEERRGILWPSVLHRQGDVRGDTNDLKKYLTELRMEMMQQIQSRPFAEMAELTPNTSDALADISGGLRIKANEVNYNLMKLYHGEFGREANIVAVDFYRSTNIVDVAIQWNKMKFGKLADETEETSTKTRYRAKNVITQTLVPKVIQPYDL